MSDTTDLAAARHQTPLEAKSNSNHEDKTSLQISSEVTVPLHRHTMSDSLYVDQAYPSSLTVESEGVGQHHYLDEVMLKQIGKAHILHHHHHHHSHTLHGEHHNHGHHYCHHRRHSQPLEPKAHAKNKKEHNILLPMQKLFTIDTHMESEQKSSALVSISANSDNDLFCIDQNNETLKKFSAKCNYVEHVQLIKDVRFKTLSSITVLPDGKMAITDRKEKLLKIFTPEGTLLKSINEHFKNPWGITSNKQGQIIVTDFCTLDNNGSIYLFDSEGKYLKRINMHDKKTLFKHPWYVTTSKANDNIIVSDYWGYRITVLDPLGNFLYNYGSHNPGVEHLSRPRGVCTDQEGKIYVADTEANRIHVLSQSGKLIGHLHSDEEMADMTDLEFTNDGKLIVCQWEGKMHAFNII
ncbi:tripartite motif-containing protein 3 [Lingula anatina]|uniref:Tripartite motif-containing protein 3 n=1 Tax=Lingula anatina TaxID=7574 RepID=A0A1S3HCW3_LINAN|nr:tripartite motif-containing protein 3 [Lingula anatina]XP_013383366.1 tripartite motif-containing protein 3 [Lingula anatina]|eukprot:XP_013383365.1 tripartite motif-containing protein 3 [Lingula anatina]